MPSRAPSHSPAAQRSSSASISLRVRCVSRVLAQIGVDRIPGVSGYDPSMKLVAILLASMFVMPSLWRRGRRVLYRRSLGGGQQVPAGPVPLDDRARFGDLAPRGPSDSISPSVAATPIQDGSVTAPRIGRSVRRWTSPTSTRHADGARPGGLELASFWLAVLCGGRRRGRAPIDSVVARRTAPQRDGSDHMRRRTRRPVRARRLRAPDLCRCSVWLHLMLHGSVPRDGRQWP